QAGVHSNNVTFTADIYQLRSCEVVLICVPTPVRDHAPDLSFIEWACREVAGRLSPGTLVCLESTTSPGCTDELVRPILESTGLQAGRDFLLACSPERIDPGNEEYTFANVPKVLGGSTPEATGMAALFYGQLIDKVALV